MTRNEVIKIINEQQYEKGLIIDDNQSWQHTPSFTRINKYLNGDLHSFFDLVADEELFETITDQFEYIFVGELFHVISLQSVIYNLEAALNCLLPGGVITICIQEDCEQTMLASHQKVVSRLELLDGYQPQAKVAYEDDEGQVWTLLNLSKRDVKALSDEHLANGIVIGGEIAKFVNQGKKLGKLKAGFLQSNSNLDQQAFKAAYTTSDEMLGLYLQNEIVSLNPCFKQQYVYKLADFVFANRNAIKNYSGSHNLQQGNFVIAYERYQNQTIVIDQQLIASYVRIFELVWSTCINQKMSNQLSLEIEKLKE